MPCSPHTLVGGLTFGEVGIRSVILLILESQIGRTFRHLVSQNCSIDVEAAKQGAILGLHIVREDFDGEISHAHLSIEVLKLAFDHNVERFEQQRIEVGLDFFFTLVFFKLFEFFSFHAYISQGNKM